MKDKIKIWFEINVGFHGNKFFCSFVQIVSIFLWISTFFLLSILFRFFSSKAPTSLIWLVFSIIYSIRFKYCMVYDFPQKLLPSVGIYCESRKVGSDANPVRRDTHIIYINVICAKHAYYKLKRRKQTATLTASTTNKIELFTLNTITRMMADRKRARGWEG